jgi:hypothetical protein
METPFTWTMTRHEAPAGKLPIVLTGAVVTFLLAMSVVAALLPHPNPSASTTPGDRSYDQVEGTRLQLGDDLKVAAWP